MPQAEWKRGESKMSRERTVWTRQHPAVFGRARALWPVYGQRRGHNAELERYGIASESALIDSDKGNFYPLPRRKIVDSWMRLFTCPPRPGDMAQATLWELRREWIEVCDG